VVHVSEAEAASGETDPARDEGTGGTTEFDTERAADLLRWVGVVVLGVTAAVALAGFYNGVTGTIRVWVSDPYQPAFRAAFNLALLLVALGGIGLLIRRGD
jgi:hypothetical protein